MKSSTKLSLSLIQDLYLKNRNFCSDDLDDSLDVLARSLPFKLFTYTKPYNSWQIPPKWDLIHAQILSMDNHVVYEVDHPLKLIGLSLPFQGVVSKKVLQEHLFYDHRNPSFIPYHFRQFYRPWERTWGFCVPKSFYDSLSDPFYKVHIETRESVGSIKVAEYVHEGKYPYSFAFVAHLDHPGMVNDDLAGVAVGVELFSKLKDLDTKFSYRLIIVPEIIGSEFYLGQTCPKDKVIESCFLEMLASKTPLALQHSYKKSSKLEKAILKQVEKTSNHQAGPFKSIICNDEYVWESHQIPMCSLSRFPYPEYHSHKDNLSIVSENALEESINVLYKAILDLEQEVLIQKNFTGTPCLSHPSYNLYVDPGQRAFGSHASESVQKLRLLMDLLLAQPAHFYLSEIAQTVQLPEEIVLSYLKAWQEKDLLNILL